LCLALAAGAAHAFLAAAGCVVLMLLTGLIDRQALSSRPARYFWLALCSFALVWAAAGVLTGDFAQAEMPGPSLKADIAGTLERLFDFPDIYNQVLRPWTRTLPVLSVGLFAAFAYLCWNSIRCGRHAPDAVSVLLSLVIVLLLAVGATPTGRMETRYTFFLYPALILLTVCAILTILRQLGKLRVPAVLVAGAPLLCFAATEDFQPRHVLDVDSERINFRVDMPRHWAEHFYPRNDIRGVAQFLAANVRPGDVVITGIPSLDEYYGNIDYFFLDESDPRYEAYVCRDGRTERWTNRPVLYTAAALKPIVASGRRVFATLYVADEQRLGEHAASSGWSVERVWMANSRTADVILIVAQPEAAHTR
jgi:hypothetical protein